MEKYFLLQLVLKTEIKDEEIKRSDGPYERYFKLFIKKFLENPDAVLSYFKEYLLILFAMEDRNYDNIKKLLEVKEDDKWHFFPVAQQCPTEIRDFIYNIYSSTPARFDIIELKEGAGIDMVFNVDADTDKKGYLSEDIKEILRYYLERRLGELTVTNAVFKEIPGEKADEDTGDTGNPVKRKKEKDAGNRKRV